MSMREKMLKSAIQGLTTDFNDDIKRMSEKAKAKNQFYITKNNDPLPYITCYMCNSKDCEEIRYGNKKQASINVMFLCKSCQQKMAQFLMSNS